MQTIYLVKISILTSVLALERTIRFNSIQDRATFLENLKGRDDVRVLGIGIDHLMDPDEAMAEIARERESVL